MLKEGGLSQGKIARLVGRAQSTVSSVAAQEGLSAPRHKTLVQANHARVVYAREQRRELLDKFLSLVEAMIDAGGMSPREVRELAQGIGTTIEKRRLEDDEAGSITETRSEPPHHAKLLDLREEFRRLDEEIEEEQRRKEQQREQGPSPHRTSEEE